MSSFFKNEQIEGAEDVPVRDAATVMVVRDAPELEVLLVQRAGKLAFAANAWVFPGGRVDRADADDAERVGINLTDAEASAVLDVESGGLAWWFAAIRETLEEVGMLLGTPSIDVGMLPDLRSALDVDSDTFTDLLVEHEISLDLGALHEVARFVTPVGPARRFDTRFFLAAAPAEQQAHPDESEIMAYRWVKPADAMAEWRAGEMTMMAVTHRMLSCLDRFPTAAAALGRAAEQPEAARLRVDDPDGEYIVYLPSDPGYETAELEVEHGTIRLY